jgi:type IV pilus assembly protein PilB
VIFRRGRQSDDDDDDDDDDEDEEEREQVLFQGALNGNDPNLAANGRLVQAGLMPAKMLVSEALSRRAEMIWLVPKGKVASTQFFVDGLPFPGPKMPAPAAMAITQMLKLLAGLNIADRTSAQAGGINTEYLEKKYVVRINTYPLPEGGERLVVRCADPKVKLETPEELNFSDDLRKKVREITSHRNGVVLAAGPPLSGTSTTCMGLLRCVDAYIYTVYSIASSSKDLMHIADFEMNPGDDFPTTVQRVARAEGDVLYIDPIKDPDMAKEVLEGSKKVAMVTEMQAKDASGALVQLMQWTKDPQLVADQIKIVVSQKLVRLLCTRCRQAFRPNPTMLKKLGLPPETKVLYRTPRPIEVDGEIEEPDPCNRCGNLGYFGRIALIEAIEMTDGIKQVILNKGDANAIKLQARKEGMQSFQSDGLRMVALGKTSMEELQRVFKQQ